MTCYLSNYSLSPDERLCVVGSLGVLGGLPYAQKHWNKGETQWLHYAIAVIEACPLIGGIAALIEYVVYSFFNQEPSLSHKEPTSSYSASVKTEPKPTAEKPSSEPTLQKESTSSYSASVETDSASVETEPKSTAEKPSSEPTLQAEKPVQHNSPPSIQSNLPARTYQEQLLERVSSLSADLTLLNSQGDVDRQIVIGKILQSIVLPLYKTPMPRHATRKDPTSGVYIHLSKEGAADYRSQLEKIQNKKIAARRIHGAMHAVRVTLWTQMLTRVYEKLGRGKVQDPILLAFAGGVHDVARQNEQVDYWDKESSDVLATLLARANVDVSKRERYIQTIREKDPKNGKFSTDEQRIVHDADCLDIIRACFISKSSFKKDLLCFWKFKEDDKAFCEQLFDQIFDFIKHSDTPALADYLEHHSNDYYGDVVRILFAQKEKFPLLCGLIEQDMQGILSEKTQASEHALRLMTGF